MVDRADETAGGRAETTPEAAVISAIAMVCSDGNSDVKGVARDVIAALYLAGYEIVLSPARHDQRKRYSLP